MAFDATDITLSFLKIGIVLALLLNVTPIMVWVERRGSALIQDRVGPNRVGPFGLLQSFADALKFILKEDMVPARAHKVLYTLAPTFGLIPAVTTVAVGSSISAYKSQCSAESSTSSTRGRSVLLTARATGIAN